MSRWNCLSSGGEIYDLAFWIGFVYFLQISFVKRWVRSSEKHFFLFINIFEKHFSFYLFVYTPNVASPLGPSLTQYPAPNLPSPSTLRGWDAPSLPPYPHPGTSCLCQIKTIPSYGNQTGQPWKLSFLPATHMRDRGSGGACFSPCMFFGWWLRFWELSGVQVLLTLLVFLWSFHPFRGCSPLPYSSIRVPKLSPLFGCGCLPLSWLVGGASQWFLFLLLVSPSFLL